jgi:adenylate kinase
MRLVLIGPPGSGKGTQAALIARRFGVPVVSTGELLRRRMAEHRSGSPEIEVIRSGAMVADELANLLIDESLSGSNRGFCLDGYPRTLGQAVHLATMAGDNGWSLDSAVLLQLDGATIANRLSLRGRLDDEQSVVEHRLRLYSEKTLPVVNYYRRAGQLSVVDADGSVGEVHDRVCKALGAGV